jgi:hypothetical protein
LAFSDQILFGRKRILKFIGMAPKGLAILV